MRFVTRLLAAAVVVVSASAAAAAEWHVTPAGRPDGDGSRGKPWDIATAFAQPPVVKAGDTIWLHGGTYPLQRALTSRLTGTKDAPIIVRQCLGESATIDVGASDLKGGGLNQNRAYYVEAKNCNPDFRNGQEKLLPLVWHMMDVVNDQDKSVDVKSWVVDAN